MGYANSGYANAPYANANVPATYLAAQAQIVNTKKSYLAAQAQVIKFGSSGVAAQGNIRFENNLRFVAAQAKIVGLKFVAAQTRIIQYNTDRLRVLTEFPSRGLSLNNWSATSTALGDFSPQNLNTDIVEQVWRSGIGAVTNQELICDTGVTQGVFVDTFAILNHNFTGSASIFLDGSNSATFSGVIETVGVTLENKNCYWVAPLLPTNSYRYWRVRLSDPANSYLEIGTIVFGSSIVFVGECFTDVVEFGRKQFVDQVQTEAFTNVKNDRGQKRYLALDFKQIAFQKSNYKNLESIIENQSTLLKCLWIPTPKYASRFAMFAKMSELPRESHNDRGELNDYIDMKISLDEAE